MVDHRLDPEHEELRKTVEQFARESVAPVIGDYYERDAFPYDLVAGMGRMGLFGLPFPEEYGGMGGDYLALCLVLEELARVDSSVAITLEAAVSLGAMPIHRYGTEEQKRTWLPRLCSGEMLGAFGLADEVMARTVRVRDGVPAVTDGPYLEAKEFVSSFWIFDAESEKRALEIVAEHPFAGTNAVEVWPILHESGGTV